LEVKMNLAADPS